ncbi:Uncharacterized protein PBTT_08498 [Plasmodiophora brassicae]
MSSIPRRDPSIQGSVSSSTHAYLRMGTWDLIEIQSGAGFLEHRQHRLDLANRSNRTSIVRPDPCNSGKTVDPLAPKTRPVLARTKSGGVKWTRLPLDEQQPEPAVASNATEITEAPTRSRRPLPSTNFFDFVMPADAVGGSAGNESSGLDSGLVRSDTAGVSTRPLAHVAVSEASSFHGDNDNQPVEPQVTTEVHTGSSTRSLHRGPVQEEPSASRVEGCNGADDVAEGGSHVADDEMADTDDDAPASIDLVVQQRPDAARAGLFGARSVRANVTAALSESAASRRPLPAPSVQQQQQHAASPSTSQTTLASERDAVSVPKSAALHPATSSVSLTFSDDDPNGSIAQLASAANERLARSGEQGRDVDIVEYPVVKHGRRGRPKRVYVTVDTLTGVIRWGEGRRRILIEDVRQIRSGKQTNVLLKRSNRVLDAQLCLSLVTNDRTLDLECKTREERRTVMISIMNAIVTYLRNQNVRAAWTKPRPSSAE